LALRGYTLALGLAAGYFFAIAFAPFLGFCAALLYGLFISSSLDSESDELTIVGFFEGFYIKATTGGLITSGFAYCSILT